VPAPLAQTLIELLEIRANETASKAAFYWDGEPFRFADLWDAVNRFGAHLQMIGIARGDRVVLALPNGPEFFYAFYGALRAGAIAVPLFPGSGMARILAMADRCAARAIVVPSAELEVRRSEISTSISPDALKVTATSESSNAFAEKRFPENSPDDVAFVQYTSGSTGTPKGVQLSHRGLLRNVRQLIEGMKIVPEDRFVSWLPVYHDMGLILKTMVPFYLAADLFLLPTSLTNVRVWLDAIQRCRATLTAAPDFAYRLCLRYVRNPGDYDLSSLRIALNAAEPVRYRTIRDFEAAFGLENVMIPGYGLAEATVGVCTWAPSTPVMADERGIVSVGRPFRDIHIEIVENEAPIETGRIGEIMIQSPANTCGYYDSRGDTDRLYWRKSYIRTGDLGYLDSEGRLFVTGRAKNIIKHAGETIFPQEIEEIVERLPAVRRSAAAGIDKGGAEGEQLYVFAELKKGTPPGEEELYAASLDVVEAIQQHLGIRPGRVYFLKPHAIPLTFNGKIQHSGLKESYLSGRLRQEGKIFYPPY
jgi:acyl-CoA synthetase (AMP-forming)/AMP-acid ligase II